MANLQKLPHTLTNTVQTLKRFFHGPVDTGGSGSIQKAGGAFGAMGTAREGQYFQKKNKEQLLHLKKYLDEQIEFHEDAIKRHSKAMELSKQRVKELKEGHP